MSVRVLQSQYRKNGISQSNDNTLLPKTLPYYFTPEVVTHLGSYSICFNSTFPVKIHVQ